MQRAQPARGAAVLDLGLALAFFLACAVFEPVLDPILRRGSGLPGVLALAGYQFACEGLIVVFLLIARREPLNRYGFTRRGLAKSLAVGLAMVVLYDLGISWGAGAPRWFPFGHHTATRMSLALPLPLNLLGLIVVVAVWGFAEGAFGVFFARKVNQVLRHPGQGWGAPGAFAFALFNGGIHLAIGQGWEGFLGSAASGYAIGVIPALTGNAWGSTLFQALTNALGR